MRNNIRSCLRSSSALFEGLAVVGHGRRHRDVDSQTKARDLSRVFAKLCQLHGIQVEIRGIIPGRPVILVCGQLSYLNLALICSHVPCTVIAKAEIDAWPIVGAGARSLGIIMAKRDDLTSRALALRSALGALKSGVSVLHFPGRDGHGSDASFHRGIFGIARLAQVPIVTLAIRMQDSALEWRQGDSFFSHYWKTAGIRRGRGQLEIGEALSPAPFESSRHFADRARLAISRLEQFGPTNVPSNIEAAASSTSREYSS